MNESDFIHTNEGQKIISDPIYASLLNLIIDSIVSRSIQSRPGFTRKDGMDAIDFLLMMIEGGEED
jgi:hypothetical protein